MAILAERFVHVIGVDTHKLTLTAAVVNNVGGVLESCEVPANAAGNRQLVAMASRYPGPVLWAVEGTGSYGGSLTEQLVAAGQVVTEVDRPKRSRRKHGKSDAIDAVRAGRDALAMRQLNPPSRRGTREELRVLQVTRAELVRMKTALDNHLQHLVVTSSETQRRRFLEFKPRSHASERLAKKCAAVRLGRLTGEDHTRLRTMRDVSRLILELSAQADAYEKEMKRLVEAMAARFARSAGLGHADRRANSGQLVASGANRERSRIREPGRSRSDSGFVRPDGASSPQPRRRPKVEHGAPHDRPQPLSIRPGDARLRRSPLS